MRGIFLKLKGDPCYVMAEYLATLLFSGTWKVENVSNQLNDLVKFISKIL